MTQTGTDGHWSHVDGATDTSNYVSYLDAIRNFDAMAAYKARSIEMLRLGPTSAALDVGCGAGDDARRMADQIGPDGLVWGIDTSAAMVEEASRRSADARLAVSFRAGSADATGFDDATFDAVRSDRVFQHLADPTAAFGELVRVLKPGGRIALSDPDWGSCLIDGPRTGAMKTYLSFIGDQAKNPWMGRQLYALFQTAGLLDIVVEAHTLFLLDYALLERVAGVDDAWSAAVVSGSALTERDIQIIRDDLRARHDAGRLFACLTVFTVSGRKPLEDETGILLDLSEIP